jgi:surface antigen
MDAYFDRWGFYNRECVSFVAWRMNRDHGAGAFSNGMRGGRWGNAGDWDDNARRLGYVVSSSPRVGAIAHWNPGEAGRYGHVAYVSRVHGDGTVDIEEYNYGARGRYGTRGPVRAPRYIYFP